MDMDQGATTKAFRQNPHQNEKHADDTRNTHKKDDGTENQNHRRVIPFCNSHGEEGDHLRLLSCGEPKKSENSASAVRISTIPINRKVNLQFWHQEMMKTAEKKKKKKHNTFDIPSAITVKKSDQNVLNNHEKPIAVDSIIGIAPAVQQAVVPDSHKTVSNTRIRSSNNGDRSRGESSESKSKSTKANTKMSKTKAKTKKTTPKVHHHKNNENNNCREATPFVHPRTSVAIKTTSKETVFDGTKTVLHRLSYEDLPVDNHDREACIGSDSRKNLDQACNDEEYGSNYHDDDSKLSREESKPGVILQPKSSSSSLLTKANLLELSRKESSTVEERASFRKREGSDEKDEEEPPIVPKTSLLRNRTEASIDVMGLSPLAELRKRAASVDKDFRIGKRPSSSSVATGTMKIQREEKASPRSHHFHHYAAQFSSRATMETDSDSEPSSPGESDGETDRYYSYSNQHYSSSSSRHPDNYRPRTPKPKQLLDQFDAVATPKASAKTFDKKMDPRPKDRNRSTKNDRTTIKDLRGDEMEVARDDRKNDIVPTYIVGEKCESENNRETRNKVCSTPLISHPSKHTTAVLDEMIATALESQTNKAKSAKSKRKGDALTRKETAKARDTDSNIKNKKREAFKRKDRSSTGPPQKKAKLIFDDETKNPNNARRVSLESPPAPNRSHQNKKPSNASKKNIAAAAADDDSSSYWSNLREKCSVPKPSLRQRRLDFDDDSSDWSADWDNLSIESIPRHKCPRRQDTSDDRPHGVATFAEVSFDSFEEDLQDENLPSAPKVYIRQSHRRTNVLNNRCSEKISKELFPPEAITHPKTISNPADEFDELFSSGEEDDDNKKNVPCMYSSSREFLAMDPTLRRVCRSSSGSNNGVKKACVVTNQSICRILLLLYVYIVLRAVRDQCNHQSLGTIRRNFGGMKKKRSMRPRIWFSENPSLSLFQASQMHAPIMM
jgi:hypothetical protein